MRGLIFLCTIAAFACTASAAPDRPAAPPTDSTPKKSEPMHTGFSNAQASFRSHAGKVLKRAPERLVLSPAEEDPSVQLEQRVGGAWAFSAFATDHPANQVRGWAVGDGTVITPEANLGLLLAEAGVWTARPALDAGALAERIAWAMGMNHRVVGPRTLHVDASGTGTLSFQVAYRPPGPGGAGGGPERITQVTVALRAPRHAQLTQAAAPVAPARPAIE
ncbi:MAG TPA: hypothetical protein VFP84_15680 [Kofleriaceae bacterium]|nr:hypothetical protein [Kofleriaceae bacterium]